MRSAFLLAEGLQPGTVAVDAFLSVGGGEGAVFEGFEVALEFRLEWGDLSARAEASCSSRRGRSLSVTAAASASAFWMTRLSV